MKKFYLLVSNCFFFTVILSQTNTFPASGNIGIGTLAPREELTIESNQNGINSLLIRNNSTGTSARTGVSFYNGSGNGDYFSFLLNGKNYNGVSGWSNRLTVQSGSTVSNGIVFYANKGGIQFSTSGTNNPDIYVAPNGNVGFSTSNPASKLSVNGNVESKEIQVKATIADYVFKENYNLMSLEEIENFIIENKHLPNVFSEKDQISNNGNIPLGQVTMSLLEKIEELTLHVIELNKRIKDLEIKE